MRIAIDAMGGDNAPAEIVKGALEAKKLISSDDEIILIGDEELIGKHLKLLKAKDGQVRIVHAPDSIAMDESPVEALRKKPKSSIAIMARLASHKQVDAVISAGNTGACVAACQLRMRTLEGVLRPGIAVVMPTFGGPVVVCDVGANINCKPVNLYQYAAMSSIYAKKILEIDNPRIGIMSIGQEAAKGNELVKKTREFLESDKRLNFIGNIEGRDILNGTADIVICEGFVGNIILKLTEGIVAGLFKAIKQELIDESMRLALKFKPVMMRIYKKYDYHEYGGAMLIGANGTAVISHGSSEARTIKNAILTTRKLHTMKINEQIVNYLSKTTVKPNEQ